jgi:hypothetical protein
MEIEDPQGERDSPEALISHAWETEERSSLRSAFRISLPWDAPALLAWRTVAPAPPRWRTGRTSGPLLVSWKFLKFPLPLPLCLSISLHIGICLCILGISSLHLGHLSLHRGHWISAHGHPTSAAQKHRLGSTVKAAPQRLSLGYLYAIPGVISLSIYISIILIYGKKTEKIDLVYMYVPGAVQRTILYKKNFQRTHPF